MLGDGVLPEDFRHPRRSTLGFSTALGATEPAQNMPDGTPNPLLRWAIQHLDLAPYLCFLDDDNLYHPTFLSKMLTAIESHPEVGIVLCEAENRRARWRPIDGYPEYRRCDNSAFLVRTNCAKEVGFPLAHPDRECVQDYEFVRSIADCYGWSRVAEPLTIFGSSENTPPARGGIRTVYSWALPVRGAELLRSGSLEEGLEILENAVEIDTLDAWAWWHLGEGSVLLGRLDRARQAWLHYMSLLDRLTSSPDDWCTYCYALAAHFCGSPDTALTYLADAIEIASTNTLSERILRAENHLNLGLYSAMKGSADGVIGHFRDAAIEGLDDTMVDGIMWKRDVLQSAILCAVSGRKDLPTLELLSHEIERARVSCRRVG